tara:strand:+ start:532 stop:1884 length:1353 start_codon:yes stop_codon:yes gene_type:complete
MLAIAILAAGKGTRMKSNYPKVLQKLGGTRLIERVLDSCRDLKPDRIFLIIGHQADLVKKELNHVKEVDFVTQVPQNGTGHAIQQLLPVMNEFEGELLVLNGDVPLLRSETIKKLLNKHKSSTAGVTFLTSTLPDPKGYGRVIANESGEVSAIIEEKDCNAQQRRQKLTNAGIYCFNWNELKGILPLLSNQNNQSEFYITDTVGMIKNAIHLEVDDADEVSGINDRRQMANCEALLQKRLRQKYMMQGVTFIDENTCTVSDYCQFGSDVIIQPQTHFRGHCSIGDGSVIGPGSLIENSEIGNNVNVLYSVISEAKVAGNVNVGPYSHIRPKAVIQDNCKIGNFVEVKNSLIGPETKINHLSYIGDSEIGRKVNIGAGTITANYDGYKKHLTIINDECKTGANSVLVAPIVLGKGVTVAAGSTLTKNVPENSLAIGRAKQAIKNNWKPLNK